MKKKIILLLILASVSLLTLTGYAQKVGISNDTSLNPQSLLHIHKTEASGQILQITNGTSGNTSPYQGFVISMDENFNIIIKNQYPNNGAGIEFWTNNSADSSSNARFSINNDGTIIIGDSSNNISINPDGQLLFNGTTTVYNDLIVPTTSTKQGGSKDPTFAIVQDNGSGSQGVFCYWFDDTQEEELYFSVQLPHDWKEGSTIYPHVHWIPSTAMSGTAVCWGMEYSWAKVGETFSASTIIEASIPIDNAPYSAKEHIITPLDSIAGTGKTLSSILLCRIYRNHDHANDTYNNTAGLLFIDFHYKIDAIGSKEEYEK